MSTVSSISHIAIVVDDLDKALWFWRDSLGLKVSEIEDVPDQEAIVAFLPVGDSEIELVKPTTTTSGMARFLANRGPGLHHVCLEVEDIEAVLERLQVMGVQLINEEPLMGSGGKKLAFIHPRSASGVLVELYQLPEKK